MGSSRYEYKFAGLYLDDFVIAPKPEETLEHVERLIVLRVEMQWRALAGVDPSFEDLEGASCQYAAGVNQVPAIKRLCHRSSPLLQEHGRSRYVARFM
ncbi:MAG TPA: hypothetical protein VKR27_08435 [Acidimicrobiales bacterium]|nr:hypothetical protein [Acidimicrobiales bacterium]